MEESILNLTPKEIARRVFGCQPVSRSEQIFQLLTDAGMLESEDIFQIILEITLYGIDVVGNNAVSVFQLTDNTDDFIYLIKRYVESLGFNLRISMDELPDDFRSATDYYCEIIDKIPDFLDTSPNKWVIGDKYQIRQNPLYAYDSNMPLNNFKAIFRTVSIIDDVKNFKLFTINYDYIMA
jgi:hypothetical protein